jgi:hypothetical protein
MQRFDSFAQPPTPPRKVTSPAESPLLVATGTRLVSGKIYLRLYHGRTDPDQEMDDWGFVGPIFGPLTCCVITYCNTFRMYGESVHHELWLDRHDDMLVWDTSYYGDMEIFVASTADQA